MFSDVLDGLLGSKLLNSFRCFRYIPGFVLVDLFGRRRLIGNPEQIMEDREAPAANKGNEYIPYKSNVEVLLDQWLLIKLNLIIPERRCLASNVYVSLMA